MKKRTSVLFRVMALVLGTMMLLGTVAQAATMPPKHTDHHSVTAQVFKAVYDLSPSKGIDGFGEKDRAGMKYNYENKWHYLDTYEFYAGSKKLGIYAPTVKETPIFRAYGLDVASGEQVNLLPTEPSKNVDYNYVGESDKTITVNRFKSTYEEYQKDDLFMAAPSKTTKFVVAFHAPADGSYDFTETVLKRFSMHGAPKKHAGVTYSVVKDGNVIATVSSEKTEANLTDEQEYTLTGKVDLKKGDDLLFIMEVSSDNQANGGFVARMKELKLTCGGKTYKLDKYPGNELVVTTRGYSEGNDLYFWYETSLDKDPDQKISDACGMRAVKKNAVLSFVAPRSGRFEISAKLQRAAVGTSTVKVTKNGATIKTYEVTNSVTTVFESIILDQDEKVNIELVYDGSGDKVYVRSLSTAIKSLYTGELDREYDNEGQTPLYSLAFMSDLHVEGERINTDEPLKENVVRGINYIKERGGVDAILLTGDVTSEAIYHSKDMQKSPWTYENIISTYTALDNALASATKTGKNIFYIAGNHDKQAGVVAEWKDPSVRIHSGSYTHWMLERTGGYYAALYMVDIVGDPRLCRYPDEVLCYRYNVGGLDIIGINQPYTGAPSALNEDRGAGQQIYPQQITWVKEQLEEIGKDKTAIVMCHYNYSVDGTSHEFRAPGQYANLGQPVDILMETMEQYPNAMYVYGHLHWRTEEESAWYNTSEQIWSFGGRTQNADGSFNTNGYQYIHAVSISNTLTHLDQNTTKPGDSTQVSQITLVDFYKDHITFEIVNVGPSENVEGVRKMTTFTIKRDMSQLDVYSGKETSTETSAFETMSWPGETTEKTETTRAPRPKPNITTIPVKKDGEKKLNPLVIIIPVAVAIVATGSVVGFILSKKKKKK